MTPELAIFIVKAIVTALLIFTTILFLATVIRRAFNERKYRQLDKLRVLFGNKLVELLEAWNIPEIENGFRARPKTVTWLAVEDVLSRLVNEERYRPEVQKLLGALGYVSFYEGRLTDQDVQVRAHAADKLGRMKSEASVEKLIALLNEDNPEVVSVAVRALSKIKGKAALEAIIARLPDALERSLVTRKTMGMAVESFHADAIPLLLELKVGPDNPWVLSCILDYLSRLPADRGSARLATEQLSNPNAEVRSKALKVVGQAEHLTALHHLPKLVLGRLEDPVWFVRLQAIRSVAALEFELAAPSIGLLLFDENWQVRNGAARALIRRGDRSLDILLDVLAGSDFYAKDSICEEIGKSNFSARLLKNLRTGTPDLRAKSRRVLEIMTSRGFSAVLEQNPEQAGDRTEKGRVRSMNAKSGIR